jgi:hypothetical protein
MPCSALILAAASIASTTRLRAAQIREPAMIPELDIWRAANLLIRRYGAEAGINPDISPGGC